MNSIHNSHYPVVSHGLKVFVRPVPNGSFFEKAWELFYHQMFQSSSTGRNQV